MSPQFARFVAVGVVAAAANVGSRLVFSLFAPYGWAIVLAYLVGMTTAYILNRMFVFQTSGRSKRDEYLRFSLVNLVALAQVWAVSEGLARYVFPTIGFHWHAETVAHAVGVATPIFSSYLGHKHFSFAVRAA